MKKVVIILMLMNSISIFGQNVGINAVNPPEKLSVGGRLITNQLGLSVHPNTPKLSINGPAIFYNNKTLEFGLGYLKEINAGKIGYQKFSDGLDFVGAGTNVNNRKIKFWAEGGSYFDGNITTDASFITSGLAFKDPALFNYNSSQISIDYKADKTPFKITQSVSDAICGCGNFSSGSGNFPSGWQSFTAVNSGNLSHIRLHTGSTNDIKIVKIYSGEGTSGSLIATTNIFHTNDNISYTGYLNIPITSGQKYTIWVDTYSGWAYCGNIYNGGTNQNGSDYIFQVLLDHPDADFIVKDNGNVGLGIENPLHKLHINGSVKANTVTANAIGINVINPTANLHIDGNLLVGTSVALGGGSSIGEICYKTRFVNINNQLLRIEGGGPINSGGRRFEWESRGGFTFNGTLVVDKLTVAGISNLKYLSANNVRPGPKSTTMRLNQVGTVEVAPNANNVRSVNINFTGQFPFQSPPMLIATPSNKTNKTEQFVITTRNVTTTSATILVTRVDMNAPWTETMLVNWWAFH